jgi:hypothetical protein
MQQMIEKARMIKQCTNTPVHALEEASLMCYHGGKELEKANTLTPIRSLHRITTFLADIL